MTPLIALPVPLLLEIAIAVGVYALIARPRAPRLESKQHASPKPNHKINADRCDTRVTAVTATGV